MPRGAPPAAAPVAMLTAVAATMRSMQPAKKCKGVVGRCYACTEYHHFASSLPVACASLCCCANPQASASQWPNQWLWSWEQHLAAQLRCCHRQLPPTGERFHGPATTRQEHLCCAARQAGLHFAVRKVKHLCGGGRVRDLPASRLCIKIFYEACSKGRGIHRSWH